MSAMDPIARLRAIGGLLARRRPAVLTAMITLLEAVLAAADLDLAAGRAPTVPVALTTEQVLEAARARGVPAFAGDAGDRRILLASLGLDLNDSGIRAALVEMHRRGELHLAPVGDVGAARADLAAQGLRVELVEESAAARAPRSVTWWWSRDLGSASLTSGRRLDRPRRDRGGPRHRGDRAHPPHTGERGMTADLSHRLGEIGAVLATRMPRVFDATLALLETVSPVLDVAGAGRYEIQRPIGQGGHAEVLLGIVRGADGFERPVAIKRMRTDQADPVKLVALIEEAHHAARLAHPNVVSVSISPATRRTGRTSSWSTSTASISPRSSRPAPCRTPSRSSSCVSCSLAWATSTRRGTGAGAAGWRNQDPRRDRRRRSPAGRTPKLWRDRGCEAAQDLARRAITLGTSTEDPDVIQPGGMEDSATCSPFDACLFVLARHELPLPPMGLFEQRDLRICVLGEEEEAGYA